METAGFAWQVSVLATTLKGELTVAPLAGDFTVMAEADVMPARRSKGTQ
jgi:hypothetical protein